MDRGERVRAFAPGQTVVARNVANSDGSVTRAVPAVAVEDDDEQLVVFIPDGTRYVDRRFDGAPVGTRAAEVAYVERVWSGRPTIRVYVRGHAVSYWWFFSPSFELTGFYGDLHTPIVRTPIGVDTRDHALDVVASPDGAWAWKDEATTGMAEAKVNTNGRPICFFIDHKILYKYIESNIKIAYYWANVEYE